MLKGFDSNQEATFKNSSLVAKKADFPSTNPQLHFSCKAAVPLTTSESIAFFSFFETEYSVSQQKLQTQCFEKGESIKDYVSVRVGRDQSSDILNLFLIAMEIKSHRIPDQPLSYYFSLFEIDSDKDLIEFDKNQPWNGAFAIEELSYSNALRVLYRSFSDELISDLHQLNTFGKRIFEFFGPHVTVKSQYGGYKFFARFHSKDNVKSFLKSSDVKSMITNELLKEKENFVAPQKMREIAFIISSQNNKDDQVEEVTSNSMTNELSSTSDVCPEAPFTYPLARQFNYEPYKGSLKEKLFAEVSKDIYYFRREILQGEDLFSRESYREAVGFQQERLFELKKEKKCSDNAMRIAFYIECFEDPLEEEALLVCRFLKWIHPDRVTAYEKVYIDAILDANVDSDEETDDESGGKKETELNQANSTIKLKKQKKRNGKAKKNGKK